MVLQATKSRERFVGLLRWTQFDSRVHIIIFDETIEIILPNNTRNREVHHPTEKQSCRFSEISYVNRFSRHKCDLHENKDKHE